MYRRPLPSLSPIISQGAAVHRLHEDTAWLPELDGRGTLFSGYCRKCSRCEHFCISFSASAASRPNLSPITGTKLMISGIAFDHFDRLSRPRAFRYDPFKIYTIVWIEPNSIQTIEDVPIVQFVCDRPGSVSISLSRSFHYLKRHYNL